jgi:hypothetical protein
MGNQDIDFDEFITGGKPNAKGQELGMTENDLIGGHPVDPGGLKARLAAARAAREEEAAEALAAPEGNIVGEAGPSGPKGPVVDRFGPAASGTGLIAELSAEAAQERRAPEEQKGAAHLAQLEEQGEQGDESVVASTGATVGKNTQQKPGAAKAQAKKVADRAKNASKASKAAPSDAKK